MGLIVVGPAAAGFLGSGMIKSGATAEFSTTSAVQITGWATDPNYPGSTIASNDLVIQSDGTDITATASIEFNNSAIASRTVTLRLLVAGVEVASSGAVSVPSNNGKAVATATATGLTVTQASLVRVTGQANIANSISATNNPASYVRVFKP